MKLPNPLHSDFSTYLTGYILAVILTVTAFAIVHYHLAAYMPGFAIIIALAGAQILVHMRCFLHISLDRSARSDLQLLLFSALIIALMVGGTVVVLFDLSTRMK